MPELKMWCWEAEGHGPDWFFIAHVTPASERGLADIAAAAKLPGYTACDIDVGYCGDHQQLCRIRAFIDTPNAEAYILNRQSKPSRNIRVYNLVEVHRDTVEVECGHGGRGSVFNQVETSFLLNAFSTPHITLQDWKVGVGGQGYDYKFFLAGIGLDSLIAYLTRRE